MPLLVAGTADEGSKGATVSAPLIPSTTNEMSAGPDVVTSIVSPESGVEATAEYSASVTALGVSVSLSVKLRCPWLSVGVLRDTAVLVVAKTIITSFGLLVVNGVREHVVAVRQVFEPAPSIDRFGML